MVVVSCGLVNCTRSHSPPHRLEARCGKVPLKERVRRCAVSLFILLMILSLWTTLYMPWQYYASAVALECRRASTLSLSLYFFMPGRIPPQP